MGGKKKTKTELRKAQASNFKKRFELLGELVREMKSDRNLNRARVRDIVVSIDDIDDWDGDGPSPRALAHPERADDPVTYEFGLLEFLDVVANDLYFDERGDWSDASQIRIFQS